MQIYTKNWLRFLLGFIICLLLRLLPFRPPNIEPIMATQMPFAKAYNAKTGFIFAFLSILIYDLIVSKFGVWTFVTAISYGLLAFWAYFYLRNKENKPIHYIKFAIMGTLAYDIVTGLSIGPIFFGQSFVQALVGQVPFTMMHLAGNISLSFVISPAIYRFVIENKNLEIANFKKIIRTINI